MTKTGAFWLFTSLSSFLTIVYHKKGRSCMLDQQICRNGGMFDQSSAGVRTIPSPIPGIKSRNVYTPEKGFLFWFLIRVERRRKSIGQPSWDVPGRGHRTDTFLECHPGLRSWAVFRLLRKTWLSTLYMKRILIKPIFAGNHVWRTRKKSVNPAQREGEGGPALRGIGLTSNGGGGKALPRRVKRRKATFK